MTKRAPKVSFLVPDINSPVLGPITSLAHSLEANYDVEIVGPDFGHGLCPMYHGSYPYKMVATPHMYRFPDYLWESRRLSRALSGDVIIAVKAYASTVGGALREKRRRGAKVMVYLDEWDGALMAMQSRKQRMAAWCRQWHHPLDPLYHPMVEKWIPQADGVLSTSSFLQRRFGGEIVHVGVDTRFFSPAPVRNVELLRQKLGLEGVRCIVFGGVARPHKGLDGILDALPTLADPTIKLVIVGPVTELVRAWQENPAYAPFVKALGTRPQTDMPLYLSLADLFVLPLNDTLLAQSQTPCKVFEAMAMAKPVIASAVSDLPTILAGCGAVVPPGDVNALAEAIRDILDNSAKAQFLGQAAREKCEKLYSKEVTQRQLLGLMERVLA